jgi:hypothetical protein
MYSEPLSDLSANFGPFPTKEEAEKFVDKMPNPKAYWIGLNH